MCWSQFAAVCWEPTCLMGCVGVSLRLYVGNLQVLWGVSEPVCGCMLGTYGSYGVCWNQFAAVCWEPTGLMGCVGASLRLYVGNLQVLWGVLEPVCGCMLGTYRSYGVCWGQFAAVCWEPTGLMGCVGASLRLYVGNLHVLWGVLGPVWGSMFGAVCWQPARLMGCVGDNLRLYVRNLKVLWGVLGPVSGCMSATYRSYGVCLEPLCGCMLATYMSYGVCWGPFVAVWQPTGLMGCVGATLGLYVGNLGNLHVLLSVLERVWGWQPAGLMGCVGASLRLYVGNLQVLYMGCV